MPSRIFSSLAGALLAWTLSTPLQAQSADSNVVSVEPAANLVLRRGAETDLPIKIVIRPGYHINSNMPAEEYLIPTALRWSRSSIGGITLRGVTYPQAEVVNYEFAEKPMQVFSGTITVLSRFIVTSDTIKGQTRLQGTLRYQACTDRMCLAPRTLPVSVPVAVE
ncbi:MAG: hypothetical protein HY236_03050 [Acidobacteria bacterium]|nr:hypothetical protein [Acidobacteriota bacterium]